MFHLQERGPRMKRPVALLALWFALLAPGTTRAQQTPSAPAPTPQAQAKSSASQESSSTQGNPDIQSLGQYALRRLSLSQHTLVWSDEVWRLHETSGGAAEGIPSLLPSGLPITATPPPIS